MSQFPSPQVLLPTAIPVRDVRARFFPLWAPWPLTALLVGFPIFWFLGLATFALPLMAVPMAMELVRRRPVRLPRGFTLWLLFLVWSSAGILVIGVNPQGTVPDSTASRLLGYGLRELSYVSITILLLYIGNLTHKELPTERVVKLLGVFFVWTVAGGVLGMLLPNLEFTSLFERLLPHKVSDNLYVQHLVHPASAQVQELGSDPTPRPAAPFAYTNDWAFNLTILAPWFFLAWLKGKRAGRRILGFAVLTVSAVILVYSLNRAAWIGVVLMVLFVAFWLAKRGRLLPLSATALVAVIAAAVFVASPLQGVVSQRLENGKSNGIRTFTTERAFELSARSPILGYGSTRNTFGSAASIAIGKTPECPQCGNVSIGINGYFYLLLMSTGYVGAALFFGLGAVQLWRARRNDGQIAMVASLVVLVTAFYGFFYDESTWLMVPFIALAVLWREDRARCARTIE